ncbi:LysR substrate-binding domain-containing protein [Bordetella genomosp. 1]|uniref:LysR family transcriptional regulator n=1 Tax=Bordetella genomosp. 1 TaxID=1395607 RepID=A0ABX4F4Q2_9BORD|nr:LysR substrate-binding domain-containing protein [Bordetella genomosp. 1]MDQ8031474.1 LysR substrate-binding domain-containing protein [Bordetella sp.]OZI68744.1 LysR family transcriptional regulator [Bordetella genomosp. 1]
MKTDLASELSFFVRVARLGSLSAAARELDLSPAAATKRLAGMEARLGVRLLNRSTRNVSLTTEGETYLHHATRILADLRAMEEAVSSAGTEPRGLLRVNATLGFGRTVIAPLVSAFCKRHPGVEVQLDVTDRPVELIESGMDLAVRFGTLPDKRLRARRILSNRRLLCASPAYLKRHGEPRTLADLAQHRCIIHRQNDEAHGVWRFQRDGAAESIKVSGALASNDGDIVLGWALDGHGILIRSEWDLAKYLESGRLRVLLADYALPSADLFVYYPQRRSQTARARMFIDFLVEHLQPRPPQ